MGAPPPTAVKRGSRKVSAMSMTLGPWKSSGSALWSMALDVHGVLSENFPSNSVMLFYESWVFWGKKLFLENSHLVSAILSGQQKNSHR
jgi:hypothetical protein